MQPNQPSLPPNYDFIMNSQQKSGGWAFLRNQDPRKRRLFAIGFVITAALILVIILMAVFSGGDGSSTALKRIIAQQTEIVRVAEIVQEETNDPAVRNRIATLRAITASDLQQLSGYVGRNGVSINARELASAQDTATDEVLESASQRGNYDEQAQMIIAEESVTYQQLISTALENSSTPATIEILNTIAENTVVYNQ